MSHRGLVAIRRHDGRYDCYDVPDGRVVGVGAGRERERIGERSSGRHGPRRSPIDTGNLDPVARRVTLRAAVDRFLDPVLHESLVVVEPDGGARPYVVLPYLLATAEGLHTEEPSGAAIALEGVDGAWLSPDYLRGWHHGVTETLGEAIDRGLLAPPAALDWLEAAVHQLAGDRHEVIGVPPSA